MEDPSKGFKLLRNALILSLVATIIPLISLGISGVGDLSSLSFKQFITALSEAVVAMALSGVLILASLLFMYRGWIEMCFGLEELFCKVSRVVKYGTVASLALLLISLKDGYSSLTRGLRESSAGFLSIVASKYPLLAVSILTGLVVFLTIVYAFYKLGVILRSGNLRVGAALLLIGPLSLFSNMMILPFGLTILGLILLSITINRMVYAEIEVEEGEIDEEFEELLERGEMRPPSRRTPNQRGMPVYEEGKEPRRPKPEELMEAPPPTPRSREVRAQLVGPNGFIARLGPGIRTFGRRDFAGFVPEEDLDYISRRHFEIRGTQQGYFIRDLGSLNGTWVNGRRLTRGESVRLVNGAVIDVAEVVRLRFISNEPEDLGVPSL
ncbi:MAG: FHA domain-containing protein [Candidatus Korarchaeota archaeon]|nr:FHA domain-containing protein [Candidatus Korarchaeota archaeon]